MVDRLTGNKAGVSEWKGGRRQMKREQRNNRGKKFEYSIG